MRAEILAFHNLRRRFPVLDGFVSTCEGSGKVPPVPTLAKEKMKIGRAADSVLYTDSNHSEQAKIKDTYVVLFCWDPVFRTGALLPEKFGVDCIAGSVLRTEPGRIALTALAGGIESLLVGGDPVPRADAQLVVAADGHALLAVVGGDGGELRGVLRRDADGNIGRRGIVVGIDERIKHGATLLC
jgi:hypothetical protein